jgi:hypothetical protein
MKKITLLFLFTIAIGSIFSSCKKEDFGSIEVTSEQLIFNIDSIPLAGPYEKKSIGKWDVDEFAAQNKIDLKKGAKEFKFESCKMVITEGNLKFGDFKYIQVKVTADGLTAKDMIQRFDIPAGADKEINITNMPNVNFVEYAQAGDVTMELFTETTRNSVPKGVIRAYPKVKVFDTKQWVSLFK